MEIFFKSHEITILRERNTSGLKYAFSATFTTYQADIQPVEIERTQQLGGRIGKTYDGFVDQSCPIKEGDIAVHEGTRYGVKSVSSWEDSGLLPHKHLILMAQD